MAYVALEKLHQLHDGYKRLVRLAGRELLLLQEEGRLYLIANRCPHMDAPLHKASVCEHLLRCPAHGIEFDLRDGRPQGGAADCVGSLEYIPLIFEGNTVGIDLV